MRRNHRYILLVTVFFSGIALIIFRYNVKKQGLTVAYSLQPRPEALAKMPDWERTKKIAYRLNTNLKQNPGDNKTLLQLATLYIQEARVTGNYLYYHAAALQLLKDVLTREPENVEGLALQSMILLSQHHFADGLAIAEKAKSLNPHYAFIYGLLIGGNVEMGNYKAAVDDADQMVSIRPDIRSYSRIAYLREIFGDNVGAIEAMKMAVDAGGNGDEPTEWARVQLGRLYENIGDLRSAEMHYTIALQNRPSYPPAMVGLGSIAMANGNLSRAAKLYEEASSMAPDYVTTQRLSALYLQAGKKEKAVQVVDKLLDKLTAESSKGEQDENIGHYADRELAYAYLLKGDPENALKHALIEYNRRPENIDVNETVGWVYHIQGKDKDALPFIQSALKTNCKNPTLLCEAGMIYAGFGDKARARELLADGLKNGSSINVEIKNKCIQIMKSI